MIFGKTALNRISEAGAVIPIENIFTLNSPADPFQHAVLNKRVFEEAANDTVSTRSVNFKIIYNNIFCAFTWTVMLCFYPFSDSDTVTARSKLDRLKDLAGVAEIAVKVEGVGVPIVELFEIVVKVTFAAKSSCGGRIVFKSVEYSVDVMAVAFLGFL